MTYKNKFSLTFILFFVVFGVLKLQAQTILIEPGHGGKDPGAVGYSGSYEKDITLIAAKELSKELKLNSQIIPILIRKNDKYLFLRERINLARKKKADLFISLHADAAISKDARGISIFSLYSINVSK